MINNYNIQYYSYYDIYVQNVEYSYGGMYMEELVECKIGGCKNMTTKNEEICEDCYREYIAGVLYKENGTWYHKY